MSFTATAIKRISGVSTTRETSAIVRLTARFSFSEVISARTRERSVRSSTADEASSATASNAGKVPVISVLLSAARDIRNSPGK